MNLYELTENYKNLISNTAQKNYYKDQVWDIIQQSYAAIGGIKGSGFMSPDDMVKNIPFWKLYTKNDKVIMALLYKDKNGRKIVALGIDGSDLQKSMLAKTIIQSFKNQYAEMSANMLSFTFKNLGEAKFKSYVLSKNEISQLIGKPVSEVDENELDNMDKKTWDKFPQLHDYFYVRTINGEPKLKVAIGTPHKKIY